MHDGQRFLRPVLRALKANELVFTACDGTGGGIEIGRRSTVTVLGQLYAMPVFPVWLCLQADAALIPMCCRTDDSNPLRQIVTFEEPIYPTTQEVMMGALADHLSLCLRDYPGDWHFWDQWRHSSGGLLVEGELNAT
jgi:lauroyl/myristoyl acyltransferase